MGEFKDRDIRKHLPLSEATYYIMLMLMAPRHGYAVMQEVESVTGGAVKIGAGTLYGALTTLEQAGLISMVGKEKRRKFYKLTRKGAEVLRRQVERYRLMLDNADGMMGPQSTVVEAQ